MKPWPERIFCDTSFFFACLESRDVNYSQALEWLKKSRQYGSSFWTHWEIIGETITLLRRKSGYARAAQFLKEVVPALQLAPVDDSLRRETGAIFLRFAKDKDLSFCDCLSYALLTTSLDRIPTATFDRHFKMLGLPVLRGDFDNFIGSWVENPEMDRALKQQRKIDRKFWK